MVRLRNQGQHLSDGSTFFSDTYNAVKPSYTFGHHLSTSTATFFVPADSPFIHSYFIHSYFCIVKWTGKANNLYICLLSDLWESDKFFYPWPTPDLSAIFRPFKLSDLESAINPSPIRKVVFIQVNQTYEETGNTT